MVSQDRIPVKSNLFPSMQSLSCYFTLREALLDQSLVFSETYDLTSLYIHTVTGTRVDSTSKVCSQNHAGITVCTKLKITILG
jgi:hypothetical protein